MPNDTKILWYIFPVWGLITWVFFASAFGGWVNQYNLWFWLIVVAPFYFGTLLYTIPLNIFTVVVLVIGWLKYKKGNNNYKTYFILGLDYNRLAMAW